MDCKCFCRIMAACSLGNAVLLSGCTSLPPEAEAAIQPNAVIHTGIESKTHGFSIYGSRPTKSYVGIDGEWALSPQASAAFAFEGTMSRASETFGKGEAPFDRSAEFSLMLAGQTWRLGRQNMLSKKGSLTASIRSDAGGLWEDYPIKPIDLNPIFSEKLSSALLWQSSSSEYPVRLQQGRFDGGRYSAAEWGWSDADLRSAILLENVRFSEEDDSLVKAGWSGTHYDDWGWSSAGLWRADAASSMSSGRIARGFKNDWSSLQLSYQAAWREADAADPRTDEGFSSSGIVGDRASLWAIDGSVALSDDISILGLMQRGLGVMPETPLVAAEDWGSVGSFNDAADSWLFGLGYAMSFSDGSTWTVTGSYMRSVLDGGFSDAAYSEWAAQSLMEMPLENGLSSYWGFGLGQGGMFEDTTDYLEAYVGIGYQF